MKTANESIKFLVNMAKAQTILISRFDRGLGGLGFSEFLILFYLNQSEGGKMRRVDLAEKVGMTASGITRLLLPMEKIGLVKRGETEKDARVRFVILSGAGKTILSEGLDRMEILAEEIIPSSKSKKIEEFSSLLIEISGRALMN